MEGARGSEPEGREKEANKEEKARKRIGKKGPAIHSITPPAQPSQAKAQPVDQALLASAIPSTLLPWAYLPSCRYHNDHQPSSAAVQPRPPAVTHNASPHHTAYARSPHPHRVASHCIPPLHRTLPPPPGREPSAPHRWRKVPTWALCWFAYQPFSASLFLLSVLVSSPSLGNKTTDAMLQEKRDRADWPCMRDTTTLTPRGSPSTAVVSPSSSAALVLVTSKPPIKSSRNGGPICSYVDRYCTSRLIHITY